MIGCTHNYRSDPMKENAVGIRIYFMTIQRKQPFILFLVTAVLLFTSSFVIWQARLDMHVRDTMLVIYATTLFRILAAVFFIAWIIYMLICEILISRFLIWFHIISTLLVLVFFLMLFYQDAVSLPPVRAYVSFTSEPVIKFGSLSIVISTIVFITGQLAFIVNVVAGLIKRVFRSA